MPSLLSRIQFFQPGQSGPQAWHVRRQGRREWESFYRDRWAHDKVVRSTHGVNCTGSCSWQVFVKDGLITWEAQAVDYPSTGPDMPDYEPRGCPRGASFSWYTYSPLRVKFPYVRGPLLQAWREARGRLGDPVAAWAEITGDPARARSYKRARGKGGFVRAPWDEVAEIIAAAHVHTIKAYGPDRIFGFTPIPAMSMVSYCSGTRFLSLIGGVPMSFYDWYADLPIASPQVFGDQTDVPESGDWWNAAYLIVWGTNLAVTRTPDTHFMTEARYRGQKVVVVSPDYADHTRFADDWLPAQPGTDAALAMAMGHVILTEFYRDRQVPRFIDYVRRFTDLPFLVTLRPAANASGGAPAVYQPDKFLTAADLGRDGEHPQWKTVLLDEESGEPVVPNGSIGFRWQHEPPGRWNLDLAGVTPALSLFGRSGAAAVAVDLPRFDIGATEGGASMRRGVPTVEVGGRLVTTVFDLLLANYGVARDGLPGEWPAGYDDERTPYTPAWQESITSVPASRAVRVAREFARSAELSGGRSMIAMGAGTNHWFHSDEIYRAMLAMLLLCGCEGVNGGGWAHYVGQEKVRPLTGWAQVAFGMDWHRPSRQQASTPFFYLATGQWRYEAYRADELASPLGRGVLAGRSFADCYAQAARLGWMPCYPSLDRNPLDLTDEAEAAGRPAADHVVDELTAGRLRFACEDPDAPENVPRVLTVWRANILGSSGKGHEYFLAHLLGTDAAIRAPQTPPELRPQEVRWREPAPDGSLDLLTTIDFRMNGNTLFSDIVLPAATWYEKYDLSTTDLHPFIHPFTPAIPPPWQTRTDWDTFATIAKAFSRLAQTHLGTRRDLVVAPLHHDSPDEIAQPGGRVADWKQGQCAPVPGRTMPKLAVVERDYPATYDKWRALGPLLEQQGAKTKGVHFDLAGQVARLARVNGVIRGGVADGRPALERAEQACEAILTLSGTTNGAVAVAGFTDLEARTGVKLADYAEDRAAERFTLADITAQPRPVIPSPEWSGAEQPGRRYAPYVINVERGKPWHTLTGRQHLFLDHDWIAELGEQMPAYRPPLDDVRHFGEQGIDDVSGPMVTVRYLTPHSKWSIHSEYQDNLHMLTLFRGGPVIWINDGDAAKIEVADNDWVEAVNRNGVVACRAVVSHRIPPGTVFMYHAKDRHVDVPKSEVSGRRGGTDNSLTRLVLKPTHLIGGYAQLSYFFNYYGPTGHQRDAVTVIRRRRREVRY